MCVVLALCRICAGYVAYLIQSIRGTAEHDSCVICCARTGQPLLGWRVSPLQLEDLSPIAFEDTAMPGGDAAAAVAQQGASNGIPLRGGPAFYRWLRLMLPGSC